MIKLEVVNRLDLQRELVRKLDFCDVCKVSFLQPETVHYCKACDTAFCEICSDKIVPHNCKEQQYINALEDQGLPADLKCGICKKVPEGTVIGYSYGRYCEACWEHNSADIVGADVFYLPTKPKVKI